MTIDDAELRRLRAAIDELAATEAAGLLEAARAEARSRAQAVLSDLLTQAMLQHVAQNTEHVDQYPAPPVPPSGGVSRPAREDRPSARDESSETALATYVYGVLAADEVKGLPKMNGIDRGHSVTTLASHGLAAVVSRVPLDEFGESRLRENLTDMSWVERVARRHEEVLETAAGAVTVIPMRLCSIYRDEAGVRDMLERESSPMQAALDTVRGKAEWGVKAFRVSSASDARRLEEVETERPQTGAGYLERQRRARQRRERADEALEVVCETIHSALSTVAARSVLLAPQRPEVSGHAGQMLLNAAYLVDAVAQEEFHATVGQLAHECGFQGVEVQITGPWPAYNFVPDAIGAQA